MSSTLTPRIWDEIQTEIRFCPDVPIVKNLRQLLRNIASHQVVRDHPSWQNALEELARSTCFDSNLRIRMVFVGDQGIGKTEDINCLLLGFLYFTEVLRLSPNLWGKLPAISGRDDYTVTKCINSYHFREGPIQAIAKFEDGHSVELLSFAHAPATLRQLLEQIEAMREKQHNISEVEALHSPHALLEIECHGPWEGLRRYQNVVLVDTPGLNSSSHLPDNDPAKIALTREFERADVVVVRESRCPTQAMLVRLQQFQLFRPSAEQPKVICGYYSNSSTGEPSSTSATRRIDLRDAIATVAQLLRNRDHLDDVPLEPLSPTVPVDSSSNNSMNSVMPPPGLNVLLEALAEESPDPQKMVQRRLDTLSPRLKCALASLCHNEVMDRSLKPHLDELQKRDFFSNIAALSVPYWPDMLATSLPKFWDLIHSAFLHRSVLELITKLGSTIFPLNRDFGKLLGARRKTFKKITLKAAELLEKQSGFAEQNVGKKQKTKTLPPPAIPENVKRRFFSLEKEFLFNLKQMGARDQAAFESFLTEEIPRQIDFDEDAFLTRIQTFTPLQNLISRFSVCIDSQPQDDSDQSADNDERPSYFECLNQHVKAILKHYMDEYVSPENRGKESGHKIFLKVIHSNFKQAFHLNQSNLRRPAALRRRVWDFFRLPSTQSFDKNNRKKKSVDPLSNARRRIRDLCNFLWQLDLHRANCVLKERIDANDAFYKSKEFQSNGLELPLKVPEMGEGVLATDKDSLRGLVNAAQEAIYKFRSQHPLLTDQAIPEVLDDAETLKLLSPQQQEDLSQLLREMRMLDVIPPKQIELLMNSINSARQDVPDRIILSNDNLSIIDNHPPPIRPDLSRHPSWNLMRCTLSQSPDLASFSQFESGDLPADILDQLSVFNGHCQDFIPLISVSRHFEESHPNCGDPITIFDNLSKFAVVSRPQVALVVVPAHQQEWYASRLEQPRVSHATGGPVLVILVGLPDCSVAQQVTVGIQLVRQFLPSSSWVSVVDHCLKSVAKWKFSIMRPAISTVPDVLGGVLSLIRRVESRGIQDAIIEFSWKGKVNQQQPDRPDGKSLWYLPSGADILRSVQLIDDFWSAYIQQGSASPTCSHFLSFIQQYLPLLARHVSQVEMEKENDVEEQEEETEEEEEEEAPKDDEEENEEDDDADEEEDHSLSKKEQRKKREAVLSKAAKLRAKCANIVRFLRPWEGVARLMLETTQHQKELFWHNQGGGHTFISDSTKRNPNGIYLMHLHPLFREMRTTSQPQWHTWTIPSDPASCFAARKPKLPPPADPTDLYEFANCLHIVLTTIHAQLHPKKSDNHQKRRLKSCSTIILHDWAFWYGNATAAKRTSPPKQSKEPNRRKRKKATREKTPSAKAAAKSPKSKAGSSPRSSRPPLSTASSSSASSSSSSSSSSSASTTSAATSCSAVTSSHTFSFFPPPPSSSSSKNNIER